MEDICSCNIHANGNTIFEHCHFWTSDFWSALIYIYFTLLMGYYYYFTSNYGMFNEDFFFQYVTTVFFFLKWLHFLVACILTRDTFSFIKLDQVLNVFSFFYFLFVFSSGTIIIWNLSIASPCYITFF